MTPTPNLKSGHEIIRAAMEARGLTYQQIATDIGEKNQEKLSVAVRGSSGRGRKSIELRRKIAEYLSLDPADVWDKVYLEVRPIKGRTGYKKVKRTFQWTPEEWAAITPSERLRSILADMDMTLVTLAKVLKVPYTSLTNAVYGEENEALRARIAEFIERPAEDIWPEIYHKQESGVQLRKALAGNAGLKLFLGFGNMTGSGDARGWGGHAEQEVV
jgi:lambda repressor-like predicted transcriptional regulator